MFVMSIEWHNYNYAQNPFNCWKYLKLIRLQQEDEISLIVIVTKVEKISCIIHGLSLKIILYSIDKIKKVLYNTIDNQQPSLE